MYCNQCGAPNPAEAAFCGSCGARFKPEAPIGSPAYPVAGLGARFLAVLLDTVLMGVVFAVAGMSAATRWGGLTPSGFSLEGAPALAAIAATLLFGFLYYWLCEGVFGATLGKSILGISVRSKDGGACTLSASLVRNLLRAIDGVAAYLVGFLVAVFSKSRQRIGDHAAKTVVVSRSIGKPARLASALAWVLLCGGGLAASHLIHRGAPESTEAEAVRPSGGVSTSDRLRVVNVAFLQSENGPVRAGAPYQPGDTVYLKYEVVGFATDPAGKTDLFLEAEAHDPNGISMYPLWEKELAQAVPAGRPVNGSFNAGLPPFAAPGAYTIELKVRDAVKDATVGFAPEFRVEAPAVAPATGLEIRDFAFSLSKEGPPAEVPVLQGGGSIFMRWRVFGVEASEGKMNAHVALEVTGPGGNRVVNEPKYIVVDEPVYYRPPTFWLPMSGRITLPGTFAKGVYKVQVTVADEAAGTEIRHAASFEMR